MLISERTRHVIVLHNHNCQHVINPLAKIVAPVIFTIILCSDFLQDISGNCKLLRYVQICNIMYA